MRNTILILLGIVMLVTLGRPVGVLAQRTYTEDFTATTYMDALNTTARWDTVAGELTLPPFVPTLAGSYDTPDYAHRVEISGDHAFVADFDSGLQVIDISDPSSPTLAVSYDTPGYVRDIVVAGNYAFVADDSALRVLDIADPTNPVLAGVYGTPGPVVGVAVSGDHAFLACTGSGLLVIDISDPTTPALAGSDDTPGAARSVAVSGDLAFVADYNAGLLVIDVFDPANPTLVGAYDTPGDAYGVVVSGDHAFLAAGGSGLQVLDISDPANPAFAGNYDTPGSARGVAVSGDRACVADYDSGLQVIDISDPTNPTLAETYDTAGSAYGVAVSGKHAFVADYGSGLQIVEIAKPIDPTLAGSCATPGAMGVAISGDYALLGNGGYGLRVVDISDPENPALLATCDTPGGARSVTISGDLVVVADHVGGLQMIDISTPSVPTLIGGYDTEGDALAVAVAGHYAYLADNLDGLRVFDISSPANPVLVNTYPTTAESRDVTTSGDYAFVAQGGLGLLVLDITNPAIPTLLGTCNTPGWSYGVTVSGDFALVADGSSGLTVFDISNPSAPWILGVCDTPGDARGVAASGNFAFVADGASGLQVIDIADRAHPVLAGSYDTPGFAWAVSVAGDHVLVADEGGGLQVIQIFQSKVDPDGNVGRSLIVDAADDTILRARLSATQTDEAAWELSADGGVNWQVILPGATWDALTVAGTDLMWRTSLTWLSPADHPSVADLRIDWLVEAATTVKIIDVPDDQGGWVQAQFTRSGLDFADEVALPISSYGIWRQVDDPALKAVLKSVPAELRADDGAPDLGGVPVTTFQGRFYVQSQPDLQAVSFPEGTWAWVASVPALQQDIYQAIVPTVADSSASGRHDTVFLVTAHTATPSVWFASPPASGYSVDDIAPGAPQDILAGYLASGVTLDWDDAPEIDFQFYRIYRGADSGFVPSLDNLIHETAASVWTDPVTNPWSYHYKITVLDHVGNESEAGSPGIVSGVQDSAGPARTALLGAVPNPFNPSTKLSFEMAVAGDVLLKIYDAAGRQVRVLVDESRAAGLHEVRWDGQDEFGRMSSAGVYLYRLEIGDFIESKRMTLIR